MMNIRPYRPAIRLLFTAIMLYALCLLTSCSLLPDFLNGGDDNSRREYFSIRDIRFSDDYSKVRVMCEVLKDAPFSMNLDTLDDGRFRVTSINTRGIPSQSFTQPVVTGVDWTGYEDIKEADICMLAFVDLTRPESELRNVKNVLQKFKRTFGDNLFLTFMLPEGKISYTMPATEYAIDVYVSHTALGDRMQDVQSAEGKSYLYSGISQLMERLATKQTHTYLDSTAHTTAVIFSSEDVYDDESNYPYDPNHFEIQSKLLSQLKDFPRDVSLFFLDGYQADDEEEQDDEWTSSILEVVCSSTGGCYLKEYGTVSFLRMLTDLYGIVLPSFEIYLDNPEGNIYIGKRKKLRVDIFSAKDSVMATAEKEYKVGDIYHPVEVGDVTDGSIWVRGSARAFGLLLMTFVILQLIVPMVRYRHFSKNHIVEYRGPNHTHNGISIPDTCYMCKGSFKPGDRIVAKCSHVVHEECWEENGQHCPEFGTNCQTGSHFYDKKHPYNFRNAPYFTEWVLLSMIAAWVSWSVFVLEPGTVGYHIVDYIVNFLVEKIDALSLSSLDILSSRQYHITLFAFNIAFFSTFIGSILSVHRRKPLHFLLDIFIRAFVAGIAVFILFGVQCACLVAVKIYEPIFLVEMIPWMLAVQVVEYTSTYRTNYRPNHKLFLYSSAILALVLNFILTPLASVDSDLHYVRLIFGYMVFFVGVTFVLVKPDAKVKHQYLSVTGGFKPFEVALYKWFLINSNTVVTIGKSVDCSMNMSIAIGGDIAPVHCSIKMINGVHKLCISDNDVELNGHKAKYHKEYRLYYGDVFQIGNVKFRYHGI